MPFKDKADKVVDTLPPSRLPRRAVSNAAIVTSPTPASPSSPVKKAATANASSIVKSPKSVAAAVAAMGISYNVTSSSSNSSPLARTTPLPTKRGRSTAAVPAVTPTPTARRQSSQLTLEEALSKANNKASAAKSPLKSVPSSRVTRAATAAAAMQSPTGKQRHSAPLASPPSHAVLEVADSPTTLETLPSSSGVKHLLSSLKKLLFAGSTPSTSNETMENTAQTTTTAVIEERNDDVAVSIAPPLPRRVAHLAANNSISTSVTPTKNENATSTASSPSTPNTFITSTPRQTTTASFITSSPRIVQPQTLPATATHYSANVTMSEHGSVTTTHVNLQEQQPAATTTSLAESASSDEEAAAERLFSPHFHVPATAEVDTIRIQNTSGETTADLTMLHAVDDTGGEHLYSSQHVYDTLASHEILDEQAAQSKESSEMNATFEAIVSRLALSNQVQGANRGLDNVQAVASTLEAYHYYYEEFNPFTFIRHLPPLPSPNDPIRTVHGPVLPKQTRTTPRLTLVLDLDETLVHCSTSFMPDSDLRFDVHFDGILYNVYVRLRPHVHAFLEAVGREFEVAVFTASQKVYADKLLNLLDPERKSIKYRLFRDSCLQVNGNYLKDLTILGRDLSQVVIVDNAPQAFGYQLSNGVPIKSWYDDRHDCELPRVLAFLRSLQNVSDVRPRIRQAFQLHRRVYPDGLEPWQTARYDESMDDEAALDDKSLAKDRNGDEDVRMEHSL